MRVPVDGRDVGPLLVAVRRGPAVHVRPPAHCDEVTGVRRRAQPHPGGVLDVIQREQLERVRAVQDIPAVAALMPRFHPRGKALAVSGKYRSRATLPTARLQFVQPIQEGEDHVG